MSVKRLRDNCLFQFFVGKSRNLLGDNLPGAFKIPMDSGPPYDLIRHCVLTLVLLFVMIAEILMSMQLFTYYNHSNCNIFKRNAKIYLFFHKDKSGFYPFVIVKNSENCKALDSITSQGYATHVPAICVACKIRSLFGTDLTSPPF